MISVSIIIIKELTWRLNTQKIKRNRRKSSDSEVMTFVANFFISLRGNVAKLNQEFSKISLQHLLEVKEWLPLNFCLLQSSSGIRTLTSASIDGSWSTFPVVPHCCHSNAIFSSRPQTCEMRRRNMNSCPWNMSAGICWNKEG